MECSAVLGVIAVDEQPGTLYTTLARGEKLTLRGPYKKKTPGLVNRARPSGQMRGSSWAELVLLPFGWHTLRGLGEPRHYWTTGCGTHALDGSHEYSVTVRHWGRRYALYAVE